MLPLPEEVGVGPDDGILQGLDGDVHDLPRDGEPPLPSRGEPEVLGEKESAGESAGHGLLPAPLGRWGFPGATGGLLGHLSTAEAQGPPRCPGGPARAREVGVGRDGDLVRG